MNNKFLLTLPRLMHSNFMAIGRGRGKRSKLEGCKENEKLSYPRESFCQTNIYIFFLSIHIKLFIWHSADINFYILPFHLDLLFLFINALALESSLSMQKQPSTNRKYTSHDVHIYCCRLSYDRHRLSLSLFGCVINFIQS